VLQLRKGQCDEVPTAVQATRRLAAWMLMEPGQDRLFQALLERCPGLLIAVCFRTALQFQGRDRGRLADLLLHGAAPCLPIREKLDLDMADAPFQGDQYPLTPQCPSIAACRTACMAAAWSGSRS
jgi:hypothetical protein